MQIAKYQLTVRYITPAFPPSGRFNVKESHYSTNLISQKGKIFNSVVARSPLQHHFTNYIIHILKFITKILY